MGPLIEEENRDDNHDDSPPVDDDLVKGGEVKTLSVGARRDISNVIQAPRKHIVVVDYRAVVFFLQSTSRYPNLIDHFMSSFSSEWLNIGVHHKRSNIRYDIRGADRFGGRVPPMALDIDDPSEFTRRVDELYDLFCTRYMSQVVGDEANLYKRFWDLWADATPSDFKDWKNYLERRKNELLRGALAKNGTTISYAGIGGACHLKSCITEKDMEGYFKFQVDYEDGSEGSAAPTFLSDIKYGLTSPQEAIIYAIQNPRIEGYSSQSIIKSIEGTRLCRESLQTLSSDCFGDRNPFLVNGVWSDDAFLAFCKDKGTLTNRCMALGMKVGDVLQGVFQFEFRLLRNQKELEVAQIFEANKEKIRELNKKLRKGLPEKLGSVRQCPGQALISMVMVIKALHASGVRRIKIPMTYNRRFHLWHPEIDRKIFEDKIILLRRLEYELNGFSAPVDSCVFYYERPAADRSGADYIEIELAEVVAPKREVIKEFWNMEAV